MLNLKLLEYRMGTNRPLPGTTVVSYCPLVDESWVCGPGSICIVSAENAAPVQENAPISLTFRAIVLRFQGSSASRATSA
jgi:hypothetical protein